MHTMTWAAFDTTKIRRINYALIKNMKNSMPHAVEKNQVQGVQGVSLG